MLHLQATWSKMRPEHSAALSRCEFCKPKVLQPRGHLRKVLPQAAARIVRERREAGGLRGPCGHRATHAGELLALEGRRPSQAEQHQTNTHAVKARTSEAKLRHGLKVS